MRIRHGATIGTQIATLALAAVTFVANAQCPASSGGTDTRSGAHYGTWGFDFSGEEQTVKPGDNFFRYANGTFIDQLVIPPDRSSYGVTSEMAAVTQRRIRSLIEDQVEHPGSDPNARKVAALYRAFMDEDHIERLGDRPLASDLAQIRVVHSKAALARFMGAAVAGYGASIFELHTEADFQNRRHYTVVLGRRMTSGYPARNITSTRSWQRRELPIPLM
jgi:putative endopeptidase